MDDQLPRILHGIYRTTNQPNRAELHFSAFTQVDGTIEFRGKGAIYTATRETNIMDAPVASFWTNPFEIYPHENAQFRFVRVLRSVLKALDIPDKSETP